MMAKIIYAIAPHCICKWEEKHSLVWQDKLLFWAQIACSPLPKHIFVHKTPSSSVHIFSSLPIKQIKLVELRQTSRKMLGKRCQCIPPISALRHTAPPLERFQGKARPLAKYCFFRESLVIRERFARWTRFVPVVDKEQIFQDLHWRFHQDLCRNPMSDADVLKWTWGLSKTVSISTFLPDIFSPLLPPLQSHLLLNHLLHPSIWLAGYEPIPA